MGFFSRIFKRRNNVTVLDADDVLLKALLGGEEITRDMAMSIPVVARAVDLITSQVSMIPIKLYKETIDSKTKKKKVEEVDDVRISLLNDDTKDTLSGVQFKKALVEDYLLDKGGYAYINKKRNIIQSLNYVKADEVFVFKNSDPIFKRYEFNIMGRPYRDYELLKILRNTKDGASGTSLTSQVSKALETAFQELKYQYALLKSGGNKRGFLKSEKRLSDEAMEKLKAAFKKLYSDNEENMIVLNEGMDFKEASNSAVELQLNETRKALKEDINDIFHIKDNMKDTFKEAIQPILTEIECSLNRDLLLEREKDTFFFALTI